LTINHLSPLRRSLYSIGTVLAISVLFILAGVPRLGAQTTATANVRGEITDQAGAAVADCAITITNQLTGLHREAVTGAGGYYSIGGLPLTGRYVLVASKAGFATSERKDIELLAGEAATIDIALGTAGVSAAVTVYGTTEGVRSDSPQLGTRLDLQKIDETPVFGRKIRLQAA
jgi:hypothetical protein